MKADKVFGKLETVGRVVLSKSMKSNSIEETGEPAGEDAPVYVTYVAGEEVATEVMSYGEAETEMLLSGPGFNLTKQSQTMPMRNRGQICNGCGFSQRDFERRGRMGCPECYTTFDFLLPPILQRFHRGRQHVGKVPTQEPVGVVMRNRLHYLEREMQNAIRKEQYEDAARMRDEISEIRMAPEYQLLEEEISDYPEN